MSDLPALKIANTGIAMGSGNEMAKNVADITLTNDDMAMINDSILCGDVL